MGRLLLFFLCAAFTLSAEATAVYLTWFGDPTTTMTIQWLTPDTESDDVIYLQRSDEKWDPIEGSHIPLQTLFVHAVSLENLKPDTEYHFRIGDDETDYKFLTAPAHLSRPLSFIVGGDAYRKKKIFRRMNQTIVKQDPLFCVIGGDIAYAINTYPLTLRSTPFKRWVDFLTEWTEQLVTPDGRLIPFLLAAGNHDISSEHCELFFSFFAFPQKQLYRAIDFGDYLSLILLDTGHFQPIEGPQTLWLEKALSGRTDIPYRFAIYHEAAYPSYYPYNSATPQKIRTYWCPLFDQYGLTAAFENHNHTFKRTHPIKEGLIDPDGLIYFGDGCWGVTPRKTNDMWYLARRARKNNVYLLELTPDHARIQALDLVGEELDTLSFIPLIK